MSESLEASKPTYPNVRLAHRSFSGRGSARPLTRVRAVNDNRRDPSWWGDIDPAGFIASLMIERAFRKKTANDQTPRPSSLPEVPQHGGNVTSLPGAWRYAKRTDR